jgi:sugar phosphate isomerase/epimerase
LTVCAVSTSWLSSKIKDGRRLVEAIKETGISRLELEYRLSPEVCDDILRNREEWEIGITSVHAVCPGRGGDGSHLNSLDKEKRLQAVKEVQDTIRMAADAGAKAIIVHGGKIPMVEPIRRMMNCYDTGKIEGSWAKTDLHQALIERAAIAEKHFESLLKSIESINGEAEKRKINIGLENRYYLCEMPNVEEFENIFRKFDGGRIFYWHDTGHAHTQQTLFRFSHERLLKTFEQKLIGIHLHDVKKGYNDHNEPGSGEVDFDMVRRYLRPDTICVMELNGRVDLEGAGKGIDFLREKGFF